MRPRLFTVRNALLFLIAVGIFAGLASWIKAGMPLPGTEVPSTNGKLVWVSDRSGHSDLWMADGKTGENAVALTSDDATEQTPVFSPNGSEVAFVAAKSATDTPQIYVMNAVSGANPIALTRTSATKQKPLWGPDSLVYYLAQGKVLASRTDNFDTDQLLPEADELRAFTGDSDHLGMLHYGGVEQVYPSPDGKQLAAVFQAEEGQVLVLVTLGDHHGEGIALGAADKIFCQYLKDGRLIATYVNGTPLQQPKIAYNAQTTQAGAIVPPFSPTSKDESHLVVPYTKGNTYVVAYTPDGGRPLLPPLPFQPAAVTVSPDGTRIAVANDGTQKAANGQPFPGLTVLTIGEGGITPEELFSDGVREPVWSPDGTQVAFVSGKDVYSTTVGSGLDAAQNLTQGKGNNSAPFWSPAVAKK